MQVSCSGYYNYLAQLDNINDDLEEKMITQVKAIHRENRKSYGSRRMSKAMQAKGYKVGRYKAGSLMRQAGVECKQRRRFRVTTQSKHRLPVAKNLLNREFNVPDINRVWVSDITYLWTNEGWFYLAVVLDLFSRRVVGWALENHMREELVHNALTMAIGRRQPTSRLMHHSDRGCQYASTTYQALLKENGIEVSMSRKGNCWDNAVAERFFGNLKSECTNGKKYLTWEEAKADVINYIEMFYNSTRLHSTLDYMSPVQYENLNHVDSVN